MKVDSQFNRRESETIFLTLQPLETLEESALNDVLEKPFAELIGAIRVVRNLTGVVAKCQANLDEKHAQTDLTRKRLSCFGSSGRIQTAVDGVRASSGEQTSLHESDDLIFCGKGGLTGFVDQVGCYNTVGMSDDLLGEGW